MWVSASEKSLRERIASCGADPLETAIAARYRHGLDIEIPELSERVFISTAAKGLFPSHFAVRQRRILSPSPHGLLICICRMPSPGFRIRSDWFYGQGSLRARSSLSPLLAALILSRPCFRIPGSIEERLRSMATPAPRSSGFSGKAQGQPHRATICWSALPRSVRFLKTLMDRHPASLHRGSLLSLPARPGSPLSPP